MSNRLFAAMVGLAVVLGGVGGFLAMQSFSSRGADSAQSLPTPAEAASALSRAYASFGESTGADAEEEAADEKAAKEEEAPKEIPGVDEARRESMLGAAKAYLTSIYDPNGVHERGEEAVPWTDYLAEGVEYVTNTGSTAKRITSFDSVEVTAVDRVSYEVSYEDGGMAATDWEPHKVSGEIRFDESMLVLDDTGNDLLTVVGDEAIAAAERKADPRVQLFEGVNGDWTTASYGRRNGYAHIHDGVWDTYNFDGTQTGTYGTFTPESFERFENGMDQTFQGMPGYFLTMSDSTDYGFYITDEDIADGVIGALVPIRRDGSGYSGGDTLIRVEDSDF